MPLDLPLDPPTEAAPDAAAPLPPARAAAAAPLRVVSVAHTAVQRQAGRLRYHPLAADPLLDVHLVVPRRWHQFGRWMDADSGSEDPGVRVHALPIRWPHAGPAS